MTKERFPFEVFPKDLANFIFNLNKTLNYNIDFLSVSLMFTIATLSGNKNKVQVKNGWVTPPIFWFMALGYPGTLKTHPIKTMLAPLQMIDRKSKKHFDAAYDDYEQSEKKDKRPLFKQMVVSDATLEALHQVHDINKRGIGYYKDELKGFFGDMNKYRKGSDDEFWLESFNNGSYIVNRVTKDKPLLIENTLINIIGTIQPDVLENLVSGSSNNGLIDRFLFTSAESKVYPISLEDMPQEHMDQYNNILIKANKYFEYLDDEDVNVIPLSRECLEIYAAYDKELVELQNSENTSQRMKNYASKIKTYTPRFALIIALCYSIFDERKIEITPEYMQKAKRIAKYFFNTAKNVFKDVDDTQEINEVIRSLNGKKKKDKIKFLAGQGFKQADIAKKLNTPKSYVSKVISEK